MCKYIKSWRKNIICKMKSFGGWSVLFFPCKKIVHFLKSYVIIISGFLLWRKEEKIGSGTYEYSVPLFVSFSFNRLGSMCACWLVPFTKKSSWVVRKKETYFSVFLGELAYSKWKGNLLFFLLPNFYWENRKKGFIKNLAVPCCIWASMCAHIFMA